MTLPTVTGHDQLLARRSARAQATDAGSLAVAT
jgi:hypothetical protein